MYSVEVKYLPVGKTELLMYEFESESVEANDIYLALIRYLYPDDIAPFGLIDDRLPGERAPKPTFGELLKQRGIAWAGYSYAGSPFIMM